MTLIFRLTQGKMGIVDAHDADLIVGGSWWAMLNRGNYYVMGHPEDGARDQLHRHIARRMFTADELSAPGMQIDHKNGDPLDNRRANLRLVTVAENCRNRGRRADNSSGHIGVCFEASSTKPKKWLAYITVENGRRKKLGRHATLEEAVTARLKAERELWGIQPRRAEAHERGAA